MVTTVVYKVLSELDQNYFFELLYNALFSFMTLTCISKANSEFYFVLIFPFDKESVERYFQKKTEVLFSLNSG